MTKTSNDSDGHGIPTIARDTQVRVSLVVLIGILACCITATAFIVRLTGQIDGIAKELLSVHFEQRELRQEQIRIMREVESVKTR